MQHDLLLPNTIGYDAVSEGVRAETLGYDSVWLGELWDTDAFTRLAAIASKTDDIEIGTAIVNVFSRSPSTIAMSAASLDEISDGRMNLGFGVSTERAIESIHGTDFDRPVRQAHETIEIVKRLLEDDEPVTYDGEILGVESVPPIDVDVPLYHAALGPANRRVVARLCDGWIPNNIPFPQLDEAFEYIAEVAREEGRDPESITVAPYVPSIVDDDEATARDVLRGYIAYYVGSGEGYQNAVGTMFPDRADSVAAAWRDGDRSEARERVSEEMVDALGVAGTPSQARDQLRELVDETVVSRPMITPPENASDEQVSQTIDALSPREFE